MKKFVSLLLALTMVMALFAGCASGKPAETTAPETTAAPAVKTTALEIMQNIWASYAKNAGADMQFPIAGGDTEHSVMDAAGTIDVKNADYLSNIMNVPAALHAQIDDAANLMHMMNANTFTAGVYHVAAGTDINAFVKTLTDGIKGTQWVCGFPEKLVVATVYGEYVVVFYGATALIDQFKTQLTTAYAEAQVVVEESLA